MNFRRFVAKLYIFVIATIEVIRHLVRRCIEPSEEETEDPGRIVHEPVDKCNRVGNLFVFTNLVIHGYHCDIAGGRLQSVTVPHHDAECLATLVSDLQPSTLNDY